MLTYELGDLRHGESTNWDGTVWIVFPLTVTCAGAERDTVVVKKLGFKNLGLKTPWIVFPLRNGVPR